MKKRESTWLERWFWPTELAYRFPHCYAPHGAKTYGPMPALERPPRPNRRGPCKRPAKHLRLRAAFSRLDNELPF
jgi:hypothetical protein